MLVPTIGLEVHTELNTKSKMFSSSKNEYTKDHNTNISVIDLAFPGTLPLPNKETVRKALKLAISLNCETPSSVLFDRKNYYYPDLPKGYQLTQMTRPFGKNGYLDIYIGDEIKRCYIHQIHLEEDTCSMTHLTDKSILDYNRCGIPLIEIVTEPVFTGIEDTIEFLENLRNIIKYLDISEASSEKGQIRVDVNISMKEENSTTLGTRSEIKNINSFNTVKEVIAYEIDRQTKLLNNNELVLQETRRWVDDEKKTTSMREKVDAIDYRYYIDPNIPEVELSNTFIEDIKKEIPLLPLDRYTKYISLGINKKDAKTLIKDKSISDYFEEVLSLNGSPKETSNWITTKILSYLNETNTLISNIYLTPSYLVELTNLISNNTISNEIAKTVFNLVLEENKSPLTIVKEHNLMQITDISIIKELINKVLDNNPNELNLYKQGKTSLLGMFIGKVIKESNGLANPSIISKTIIEEINKR